MRLAVQLAILAGAFAVGTGVAELFGAANLGTALGIGQIAFAVALMALLLSPRRPRSRAARPTPAA